MGNECNQVNTPTTDNSELACENYVQGICVNIAMSFPFLGVTENTSLEELLFTLVEKVKNQQRQINNLNINQIDLINRVTNLENN